MTRGNLVRRAPRDRWQRPRGGGGTTTTHPSPTTPTTMPSRQRRKVGAQKGRIGAERGGAGGACIVARNYPDSDAVALLWRGTSWLTAARSRSSTLSAGRGRSNAAQRRASPTMRRARWATRSAVRWPRPAARRPESPCVTSRTRRSADNAHDSAAPLGSTGAALPELATLLAVAGGSDARVAARHLTWTLTTMQLRYAKRSSGHERSTTARRRVWRRRCLAPSALTTMQSRSLTLAARCGRVCRLRTRTTPLASHAMLAAIRRRANRAQRPDF